jgi:hypothetical protein
MADETASTNSCLTCGFTGEADEFYEASSECRRCKRERSRRNRQVTALKVALADRFIELVAQLADEGALCELAFTVTKRPLDSDSGAAQGPE